MTRPCFARIHLERLRKNFQETKRLLEKETEIFPVIKADAYGHGAVECARALLAEGAKTFCVACTEEALEILESGLKPQLILLSGFFPGEEKLVVEKELVPVISELEGARELDAEARRQNKKIKVHLKIDTGMGRLGVPTQAFSELFQELCSLKSLEIQGILSHLSCANSNEEPYVQYSLNQIRDFSLIVKALKEKKPEIKYFHLAGSAGLIKYPEAHFNAVRPGLMLYGANPFYPEKLNLPHLEPVMSLLSKIVLIKTLDKGSRISYGGKTILPKKTRIGVVPIGYADGLPRNTPPGFKFLVKGKPASLLGVITMDLIILDLSEVPEAMPGNEVLLFGREHHAELNIEQLAYSAQTISYEIFTRLGKRVKREYLLKE